MKFYKNFVRDTYNEGELCPWYKGFVYRDYARRDVKVTLIGFNVLFQLFYSLWLSARIGIGANIQFQQEQIRFRKYDD